MKTHEYHNQQTTIDHFINSTSNTLVAVFLSWLSSMEGFINFRHSMLLCSTASCNSLLQKRGSIEPSVEASCVWEEMMLRFGSDGVFLQRGVLKKVCGDILDFREGVYRSNGTF